MPIWHAARRQPPADEKPRMPVRAARGASRRQIMRRYHAGSRRRSDATTGIPERLSNIDHRVKEKPAGWQKQISVRKPLADHWSSLALFARLPIIARAVGGCYMRSLAILLSAMVIVLLVDFAFYEGRLRKEAWEKIQTQQTNVQEWKIYFVSGR